MRVSGPGSLIEGLGQVQQIGVIGADGDLAQSVTHLETSHEDVLLARPLGRWLIDHGHRLARHGRFLGRFLLRLGHGFLGRRLFLVQVEDPDEGWTPVEAERVGRRLVLFLDSLFVPGQPAGRC